MSPPPLDMLRFEEAFFERVWGGNKLAKVLHKPVPPGKTIGEAWLISDHPRHESVVAEGPHCGKTLRQLRETFGSDLMGNVRLAANGRFPLLLKLLDTAQPLSIQVHPDDATAAELGEADGGKTEAWHILAADPGSTLICGFREAVTPEQFDKAVEAGNPTNYLKCVQAHVGMNLLAEAGTVHALGAGLLVAEIQQNSDVTYRIYDWERQDNGTPRTLHPEKARRATNFSPSSWTQLAPRPHSGGDSPITQLICCPYFAVDSIHVESDVEIPFPDQTAHILLCVEGTVSISASAGTQDNIVRRGDAIMVPACASQYACRGNGTLLRYYVP